MPLPHLVIFSSCSAFSISRALHTGTTFKAILRLYLCEVMAPEISIAPGTEYTTPYRL